MMNKNFIYILLSLFLLQACDSDFLNRYPKDQVSGDTFWGSEQDALSGLNAVYDAMQTGDYYMYNNYMYNDGLTPNAYSQGAYQGFQAIGNGTHTATAPGAVAGRWTYCYAGVYRANLFLENVGNAIEDEALLNRTQGEARFLRALYYHNLVMLYGDVPLILKTQSLEEAIVPRTPKADVLAQIHADLDFAANNLPDAYEGSNIGRVTKGAALALKARVHLYEGEYQQTVDLTQQIINMNQYGLVGIYEDVFSPQNENNEEVVFDVQYIAGALGEGNRFDKLLGNRNAAASGWSSLVPVKELVDAYECIDGLPIDQSPLFDADNPYENRDPRLASTVITPGSYFKGALFSLDPDENEVQHQSRSGFLMRKYVDSTDEAQAWDSPGNFIVIRYADVLLMYAEAKNELSGPDAEVYEAINAIRTRVGMPEVPTGLTQEEMRSKIRHERRVELAIEGLYYFDILRWKTVEEVNNGDIHDANGKVVESRSFNPERDYLWPIPQSELDLNPELEQNKEY
ncbi:RagB/SusD family nutrient uptake outer membrane protein [Rapidithrix thailandica]